MRSRLESMDDNALAAELVRGEHEALAILFRRHSGVVLHIARRILGDHGEAEDVTQQVFIEVYRSIAQFDPQRGPFRSWLLKRAVSRAINRKEHLNSQYFYAWREMDEGTHLDSSSQRGVGLHLFAQEISYLAKELLHKLPTRERKVIKSIFFDGLTAHEVSGKTGQSLPTVRRRFYEGLGRLRSILKERRQIRSEVRVKEQCQ